jgi:hypothetical protein
MTVLNYLLTDEAVYILTDTLLSDPDDLSPVTFTTKIHALPHLQAVVCGTGHAQAITEWVATVNLALVVRDVPHLDQLAPTELRKLFALHPKEGAGEPEITTTLYHFGFDERAGRFVGFAYRSADDFRSEPLPQGFGLKPAPDWPLDGRAITRLPDDFIAMAEKQKAQDEAAEAGKRVMVGGKLLFCVMQRVPGARNNPTVQSSLAVCHSFPEFKQLYAQAAARLLQREAVEHAKKAKS